MIRAGARYRKRPVVVEAIQFTNRLADDPPGVYRREEDLTPYVVTIHGQRAYLSPGDWIVTEPDGGHHYPVKPDIFAVTYEPETAPRHQEVELEIAGMINAAINNFSAMPVPIASADYEMAREIVAKVRAATGTGDAGAASEARRVAADVRNGRVDRDRIVAALEHAADALRATPSASTDGVARIAAERRRQIEREGWTAAHDNGHIGGELAMCAAIYAMHPDDRRFEEDRENDEPPRMVPIGWPFDCCDFKPGDRIRELEKAGALIAAEIDRLLRATPSETTGGEPR